jgi:hypothetical protein
LYMTIHTIWGLNTTVQAPFHCAPFAFETKDFRDISFGLNISISDGCGSWWAEP